MPVIPTAVVVGADIRCSYPFHFLYRRLSVPKRRMAVLKAFELFFGRAVHEHVEYVLFAKNALCASPDNDTMTQAGSFFNGNSGFVVGDDLRMRKSEDARS